MSDTYIIINKITLTISAFPSNLLKKKITAVFYYIIVNMISALDF